MLLLPLYQCTANIAAPTMSAPSPSEPAPLWTPADPEATACARFRDYVNKTHSLSLSNYADLYKWSIEHRSDFWSDVWDFEGVIGDKGQGSSVDEHARPADNPLWFEGASLNWAENQLRHVKQRSHEVALIQAQESCPGMPGTLDGLRMTWTDLNVAVGKTQRAMKAAGVQKGDTIAFWGGTCPVRSEPFMFLL
jgi:acetoacetyl-CoA synthetase